MTPLLRRPRCCACSIARIRHTATDPRDRVALLVAGNGACRSARCEVAEREGYRDDERNPDLGRIGEDREPEHAVERVSAEAVERECDRAGDVRRRKLVAA